MTKHVGWCSAQWKCLGCYCHYYYYTAWLSSPQSGGEIQIEQSAWRCQDSLHTVDFVPRVEVSQEEEVQELLGHIFILIQNVLEEQHVDRVMNSNINAYINSM